jgi:two-component system, NarL family, sensor histidine kinase BarA
VSYNSLKRVLGETSLERKCRFLFGGCLLVLITSSFWWYGRRTEELVYQNTRNTGKALVNPIMVQLHYAKQAAITTNSPDAEGLANQLARLWKTTSFEFEIFSKRKPPKAESKVDLENYQKLIDLKLNVKAATNTFATPPMGEQQTGIAVKSQPAIDPSITPTDDEQAEVVINPQTQQLLAYKEAFSEARDVVNGKYVYSYYQPIFVKDNSCLKCHPHFGKQFSLENGLPITDKTPDLGDCIGVVKVILPDSGTQSAINFNRAVLLATAIITVFLAMIAAYVIVRYIIVKPLKHLRDVSDEVSRGDFDARADIQTADEFEELAKAFNKMLRHLVSSQEDLRQANINLDLKVDELAQLNMRLYEMNRLKSDFMATMSHELRTPLNSIIGFSDVLSSIKALDEKQRRYVQNIQKSGRMLLDMINDILDLAKIESGKMEIKLSEFTIEQVVSTQVDMARPLAERKNIDLDCELDDDLPPLYQDAGKLQQILNNLLSNAIKFTPEGGRIVVSATRDEETGDLILNVIDNGVGISTDDQTAIFEKFRQGTQVLARGDAMTREYSGTGLGLSIVKEICKLLGGEISLRSELGQGSTFTVQLPWIRSDAGKLDLLTPGLGKVSARTIS